MKSTRWLLLLLLTGSLTAQIRVGPGSDTQGGGVGRMPTPAPRGQPMPSPAPAPRASYAPPAPVSRPSYTPSAPSRSVPQDAGPRVVTTPRSAPDSTPRSAPVSRPNYTAPAPVVRPSNTPPTTISRPSNNPPAVTQPTRGNSQPDTGGRTSGGSGWNSGASGGNATPSSNSRGLTSPRATSSRPAPVVRGLSDDIRTSGRDTDTGLRPRSHEPAEPGRSAVSTKPAAGWNSRANTTPNTDGPPKGSANTSDVWRPISTTPTPVNAFGGAVRPVQAIVPPLTAVPAASPATGNASVGVIGGIPFCPPTACVPFGSYPWTYGYGSNSYWSYGCWDPSWSPCSWLYSPAWCTPSWCFYAPGWSWVSWCRPSWRVSVGFGYCSTSYWDPCATSSYLTYGYYPWSYYSTVAYYPGYSTLYHRGTVVDYLETSDPYVEYESEVIDGGVAAALPRMSRVPVAFHTPLDPEFPTGLSPSECLARGEGWLRTRNYLLAAEAFRRAWMAQETDAWAASQLGLALAASGRWTLSASALSQALELDGSLTTRAPELITAFASSEVFARDVLVAAQKCMLRAASQDVAFVMACSSLCLGDAWGAREGLLRLKEAEFLCGALQSMIDCCELKISGAPDR